ncbi:MAG TPA: DUF6036 family nucleotidyltransferase [Thermoanaerobaculia bacterium]|jgi:hypothetical protein|nr:DUF6036 family nucleotidyltransferase [Thermoanaerobaculia bacterium]
MRRPVDAARIREFMRALARESRSPHRVYFTGGVTAVLMGWRSSTIDIDIKIEPEGEGLLRAIPEIKEKLGVNVELASPDHFIPELEGWRDRSIPIGGEGSVEFAHYDPYAQALAKIERGHRQDLEDVGELFARGLVDPGRLQEHFRSIEPFLYRYPAVDPRAFREAVRRAAERAP